MKNYVLFCCCFLTFSISAQIDWLPVATPISADIRRLLGASDGTLYLQTGDDVTLYRSDDDGESWLHIPNPSWSHLSDLRLGADGTLYGISNSGIHQLPPGSLVWSDLPYPDHEILYSITALNVLPDGGIVIMDEFGNVQYLPAGSDTWELPYENSTGTIFSPFTLGENGYFFVYDDQQVIRFNLAGDPPVVLEFPDGISDEVRLQRHPAGGMVFYANGYLLRSADNGDTWSEIPTVGVENVTQLSFGLNDALYLYNSGGRSAYRSEDNGLNWEFQEELLSITYFAPHIKATPWGAEFYYNGLCGAGTLLRTTDGGETYENITPNYPEHHTRQLSGRTTTKLFAKTCAQDWQVSSDEGNNWGNLRIEQKPLRHLDAGPDHELIAITVDNLVYISLDDGANWQEITPPNAPGQYLLKANYLADNVIAILGADDEIHYSTDGGNTFQSHTALAPVDDIHYHPDGYLVTGPSYWGAHQSERIDMSDNTSDSLDNAFLTNSRPYQFLILPSGVILHFGQFHDPGEGFPLKLHRSEDVGSSFSEVLVLESFYPSNLEGKHFLTQDTQGRLYLMVGNEILLSLDDGLTWQTFLTNPPGSGYGGVYVDADNFLYLIRYKEGIYRSGFSLSAYGSVSGSSWIDINYDCLTYESNEYPFPNHTVQAINGTHTYYGYGTEGGYNLILPEGAYTLNAILNNPLYEHCEEDIGIDVVATEELMVNLPIEPVLLCPLVNANVSAALLRRCFDNVYTVRVCNEGTLAADNPTVQITLDPFFTYVSSTLIPLSVEGSNYTFALPDLLPGTCSTFYLTVNLSCEAELGQEHCISWVTDPGNECAPSYQTDAERECQENVGSYDPNDKRAFVDGHELTDYILPETERMVYHIRFQNTGTDTAFTVEIKDRLPAALDVGSFHLENSSHPCTVNFRPGTVPNTHEVSFLFANILLPDSTTNEPASHGFVKFSIDLKEEIVMGENINNFADIFFDFNEPVRTNTVALEYNFPTGVSNPNQEEEPVAVYPNPATDQINLVLKDHPTAPLRLTIYNTQGQAVQQQYLTQKTTTVNVNEIPKGLYYIHITRPGERAQGAKIVIQ